MDFLSSVSILLININKISKNQTINVEYCVEVCKMKNKLGLLLFMSVLFFSLAIVTTTIAQDDHHHDDLSIDQCDNPTLHVVVNTVHYADGSLTFGDDEIRVSKGSCVMLHYINPYDSLHDFVIDPDTDSGFEGIHLALENSTAGIDGTNQHIVSIQMPDMDITLEYYCSVAGHKEVGMFGKLIIGDGSPDGSVPGFDLVVIGIGFISIFLIGTVTGFNISRRRTR